MFNTDFGDLYTAYDRVGEKHTTLKALVLSISVGVLLALIYLS